MGGWPKVAQPALESFLIALNMRLAQNSTACVDLFLIALTGRLVQSGRVCIFYSDCPEGLLAQNGTAFSWIISDCPERAAGSKWHHLCILFWLPWMGSWPKMAQSVLDLFLIALNGLLALNDPACSWFISNCPEWAAGPKWHSLRFDFDRPEWAAGPKWHSLFLISFIDNYDLSILGQDQSDPVWSWQKQSVSLSPSSPQEVLLSHTHTMLYRPSDSTDQAVWILIPRIEC